MTLCKNFCLVIILISVVNAVEIFEATHSILLVKITTFFVHIAAHLVKIGINYVYVDYP